MIPLSQSIRELLIKQTGEAALALNRPEKPEHGDYASPVALALAKKQRRNAMTIAHELAEQMTDERWEVSVAPPGFLNFRIRYETRLEYIGAILDAQDRYGSNEMLASKKVMVEYTDPNPFKEFHIGHLMSNAIGEALLRIIEFSGAETKRANYQGDVGLHVAKAVWAMDRLQKKEEEPNHVFLGRCYAFGAARYEQEEIAHAEITLINKQIFEKSNPEINAYYDQGRAWSLAYFEEVYKRLGTHFDEYFFESATGPRGKAIAEDGLKKNIFEQSDGAVVYRGEKKAMPAGPLRRIEASRQGLHTRVFISSAGLPTYEAKELGLAFLKQERWPHDLSFVVTANEIKEYFRVVMAALAEIDSALAKKITHVPHGFLRLPEGKMSSRTGNVIAADDLLDEAKKRLREKTADEEIAEAAAVGAVKYSILRQSAGKDIIFDFDTSLSFEGDSGPYLQYTHARARSVLERAKDNKDGAISDKKHLMGGIAPLERFLLWFPDVVEEALKARDPHYIANYLFSLAQAFNAFYAHERIIGADEERYKLALTKAVAITLKNGLGLLAIPAPDRM